LSIGQDLRQWQAKWEPTQSQPNATPTPGILFFQAIFLAGVLEARRSSKPSDGVQILGEELHESSTLKFQGDNMPHRTKSLDPILHVRYNGRSVDLLLSDLDIGSFSDDQIIRRAVAEYLGIKFSVLQGYAVDRHPNGNLTIRPQAVFG
jgi:hypothetical protein